MRRLSIVLAILLVAGCLGDTTPAGSTASPSSSSAGPAPLTTPSQAPQPAPNADTGALAVLVVTTEMQPVAAAQVVITPADLAALTDAEGRATFNDLAPGDYVVATAKPGYRAREAEGRVARIEPEATVELRLTLDPVQTVTPDTAFHETIIMRGLISCSVDVRTSVQTTFTGYSNYCGRGVMAGGQTLGRDPNDNSSHPWLVKNAQVEGWWFEASWKPSSEALSRELFFQTLASYSCNVTCSGSMSFSSGGGASPYRALVTEGAAQNITKWLGTDPAKYPKQVLTLVRGHCTAPCVAATLNQKYDAFATVFYGEDPPAAFSALPK